MQLVIQNFVGVLNSAMPFMLGLAVIAFIYGVIRYIAQSNNPKARAQGSYFIIYGVASIAVLLSMWGLARLLKDIFFPGVISPTAVNLGVPLGSDVTDFKSFVARLLGIGNSLIPLLMAFTVIGFMWGVARYILHGDNERMRAEGRTLMIYGIIAFALMISIWGVVYMIKNSLFPTSATPLGALIRHRGDIHSRAWTFVRNNRII